MGCKIEAEASCKVKHSRLEEKARSVQREQDESCFNQSNLMVRGDVAS